MFDLAALRLQSVVKILRKALITDFYQYTADADASGKMVGIRAICDNTKTVGGIDQSANPYWRGCGRTGPQTGSAGSLTWALMNKMYNLTKRYGDGDPATLIVTTEGVLQEYEDNLTKVTTTAGGALATLPLVQLMSTALRGPRVIDGGFDAFYFKRIPVVADQYIPTNVGAAVTPMYFLNERYLHWRVLKNFDTTGWTQLRPQGYDWVQNIIYGYGALTCSANTKQGVMVNLKEA